jgi:hypothetical protein
MIALSKQATGVNTSNQLGQLYFDLILAKHPDKILNPLHQPGRSYSIDAIGD